ncbi:MAG: RNA methyltransferase [Clostridia bacterium]|nr:RNA methyltransferase [Clostridia bacterium]
MNRITSLQNEYIKQLAKLKTPSGRKLAGQFMVEGKKLCEEALRSGQKIEKCLVVESEISNPLLDKIEDEKIICISDHIAKKLSQMDTCPGIFFILQLPEEKTMHLPPFILALDHLSDPANLGAVLRSAEAFGTELIYLSEGCVDLYSSKTLRGAMGSAFRVATQRGDLAKFLEARKADGYRILGAGLDRNFKELPEITFDQPTVVVIGNEANGISQEILHLCDHGLFIPMKGENESLNAAVAASIILWEQSKWK